MKPSIRTNEVVVAQQLAQLNRIADHGIPEVYDSVEEFLGDFFMDFSWGPDEVEVQLELLMADPGYESVKRKFEARFAKDLDALLIFQDL